MDKIAKDLLDRINRINRMGRTITADRHRLAQTRYADRGQAFAQERLGAHQVQNQASLVQHSMIPKPANAAHRLHPSDALERAQGGVLFCRTSTGDNQTGGKLCTVDERHDLSSRATRIVDPNASALGWSGEQEMAMASVLARAIWWYPRYLEHSLLSSQSS